MSSPTARRRAASRLRARSRREGLRHPPWTRSGPQPARRNVVTLLADVVTASNRVAETSSRSAKIATLADLLRTLEPHEVPIVTGFLSGVPRQGRVGVGY